jgi:hypothetical protein
MTKVHSQFFILRQMEKNMWTNMSNFDLKENFLLIKNGVMSDGALGLKRGEKSSKFPIANFCLLFSDAIFKQFCNIMATQNKN